MSEVERSNSGSAVLQDLANQVRKNTIRILEEADSGWMMFAPEGTSNHMVWHAGHVLWLQDVLCLRLLTGNQSYDQEWADTFGMNCRSPAETVNWPERDDLLTKLHTQHSQILDALSSASDEDLSRVADPTRGPLPVSSRIIHGFYDEARHAGEMYLISKMCRR